MSAVRPQPRSDETSIEIFLAESAAARNLGSLLVFMLRLVIIYNVPLVAVQIQDAEPRTPLLLVAKPLGKDESKLDSRKG